VEDHSYLELVTHAETRLVALTGEQLTVGKDPANDVNLDGDPTVSRLHAVLDRYPSGWSVRDIGSRNGTYVNGRRIWQERPLRDRDEIGVGAARLVYRSTRPEPTETRWAAGREPPVLTTAEREVLVQLCLPALDGRVFARPASDRRIAAALNKSVGAVKQQVAALCHKFGIHDGDGEGDEPQRDRLANEALTAGAVTVAVLRAAARQAEGRRR
jgi:hypothetical protein